MRASLDAVEERHALSHERGRQHGVERRHDVCPFVAGAEMDKHDGFVLQRLGRVDLGRRVGSKLSDLKDSVCGGERGVHAFEKMVDWIEVDTGE